MEESTYLLDRIESLENHLAIVVSLHLFVENRIDSLIAARAPTAKRILSDHRAWPFSVKVALVFNMGLISAALYENLAALNRMRNALAHSIEVELSVEMSRIAARVGTPDGSLAFPAPRLLHELIEDNPAREGKTALRRLAEVTHGWLSSRCRELGVVA